MRPRLAAGLPLSWVSLLQNECALLRLKIHFARIKIRFARKTRATPGPFERCGHPCAHRRSAQSLWNALYIEDHTIYRGVSTRGFSGASSLLRLVPPGAALLAVRLWSVEAKSLVPNMGARGTNGDNGVTGYWRGPQSVTVAERSDRSTFLARRWPFSSYKRKRFSLRRGYFSPRMAPPTSDLPRCRERTGPSEPLVASSPSGQRSNP